MEHEFYDFPYIGNVIIPTNFHIFQRGRYTTNQSKYSKYIPILPLYDPHDNPHLDMTPAQVALW